MSKNNTYRLLIVSIVTALASGPVTRANGFGRKNLRKIIRHDRTAKPSIRLNSSAGNRLEIVDSKLADQVHAVMQSLDRYSETITLEPDYMHRGYQVVLPGNFNILIHTDKRGVAKMNSAGEYDLNTVSNGGNPR